MDSSELVAREIEEGLRILARSVLAQLDLLRLWKAGVGVDDAAARATIRALWVLTGELLKVDGLDRLGEELLEMLAPFGSR